MSKKPLKISSAIPKAIWVVLFLILAYFLWMEHRAHVIEYLPIALLLLVVLLCPLMHLFMHHGHGGHDHKNTKSNRTQHDEEND